MQVYHGTIITCDDNNTVASYLVEKEGRIAYVGDTLPEQYGSAEVIELGKGALVPSFVDTFSHYSAFSYLQDLLYFEQIESNTKILEGIKKFAQNSKDQYIVCFGASGYSVEEGHLILKEQLDAVCPDRPVCVVKYDARSCVVNTAFLRQIKDRVNGIRGFNEATGELSKEAFLVCMDVVTKSLSTRRVIDSMVRNIDRVAAKGIGMVHSSGGIGSVRETDVDMENSVARGLDNGFQMRIAVTSTDVDKIIKKGFRTIDIRPLDGFFGTEDAALIEPYGNSTEKGVLYFTDSELLSICKEANRKGLQIRLRAVGDAAFEQATRVLRETLEDYPRYDHRHMIIHACLPTASGIEICSRYKIYLSCHPSYIRWGMESKDHLESVLGHRLYELNPIKRYLDAGIKVCFSSNAPSTMPDPIRWIHNACNNHTGDNSVSVYEALRMCTINSCYSSFDERERGTLEVGKVADMVVLDTDPYDVPVEKLENIKVSQLYLGGKPYEHSKIGAMTTMLRGMFPQAT